MTKRHVFQIVVVTGWNPHPLTFQFLNIAPLLLISSYRPFWSTLLLPWSSGAPPSPASISHTIGRRGRIHSCATASLHCCLLLFIQSRRLTPSSLRSLLPQPAPESSLSPLLLLDTHAPAQGLQTGLDFSVPYHR